MLLLAQMLRRFASTHDGDTRVEEVLAAANALETRAHTLAEFQEDAQEKERALHAPVDLRV